MKIYTKEEASELGLEEDILFFYSIEYIKQIYIKECKDYPKAKIIIVNVKNGYTLYVDEVYKIYKEIEYYKSNIRISKKNIEGMREDFEKKIREETSKLVKNENILDELENELKNI